MKKNALVKIFIALTVATTICVVLSMAFTTLAQRNDPDFFDKSFAKLRDKINEGKSYEETFEEDISNVKTVFLNTVSSDIEVSTYEGSTLKMSYSGQVPKDEAGPLVKIALNNDSLTLNAFPARTNSFLRFQWDSTDKSFGMTDKPMTTKILLPQTFKGAVVIKTTYGDIDFNNFKGKKIEITNTSGNIEIDNAEVDSLLVTMLNGDFNSENSSARHKWHVQNTNGDINVALAAGHFYEFSLSSTNGDIQNESGMSANENDSNAAKLIAVTLTGNVTISKYQEPTEDRE